MKKLGFLGVLLLFALQAAAQSYPVKPVRMVVPYPPGGGNDTLARLFAAKLSDRMGQQFVVENRPGAGAMIGTEAAAKSTPDGYTILLSSIATHALSPNLYSRVPYDPVKDFAPITLLGIAPTVLVVPADLPARNLQEFIAAAKAKPGALAYASGGNGTPPHINAEVFKAVAGIDVVIIPYKGTAGVMNDLLGGHVTVAFGVIPPALGNIQSGKLRAVAVASPTRTALLPDTPTFAESGMPGFEAVLHYGLLAPAGTPRAIVDRLNTELRKLASNDEVKKRISSEGGDPLSSSPDEYAADIDREETKWSTLIRRLNLKVE